MTYYVYAHYVPGSNVPFYIGVGTKVRAYNTTKRSVLWKRYVAKYGLDVKILTDNLSKDEAMSMEKQLIKEHGRLNNNTGVLVNLTDGGEGTYGVVRSVETRRKLSEAQKNKHHTEETKQKLREINLGKKRTDETKKKISKSMSGKTHTKETREKLSRLLKGRVISEEHKRKLSEATKKWYASRK